jgi:hypothetical protein
MFESSLGDSFTIPFFMISQLNTKTEVNGMWSVREMSFWLKNFKGRDCLGFFFGGNALSHCKHVIRDHITLIFMPFSMYKQNSPLPNLQAVVFQMSAWTCKVKVKVELSFCLMNQASCSDNVWEGVVVYVHSRRRWAIGIMPWLLYLWYPLYRR